MVSLIRWLICLLSSLTLFTQWLGPCVVNLLRSLRSCRWREHYKQEDCVISGFRREVDENCTLLTCFNYQLNAQFLYSITICMLHYNLRHVSSINMPIFRRTNCIIAASGIVTLCKRLYSMLDESRLQSSLRSSGILYCTVQRVKIPDAVIIQFVLLKMGMLMLETCRRL